jgi:hypothetical protein
MKAGTNSNGSWSTFSHYLNISWIPSPTIILVDFSS